MVRQVFRMLVLGMAWLLINGCQGQSPMASRPPLIDAENHEALKDFVAADVDFERYHRVSLAPCDVAFRPDWLRQNNSTRRVLSRRLSEQTQEALAAQVRAQCETALSASLQLGPGYKLVTERDAKTLVLKPRIIDLQVAAPDTQSTVGWSRSFTNESASMTMVLDALDSESGELVLRLVDSVRSPDTPGLEWSNRVTNRADLQRMLNRWAARTREQLDAYLMHATHVARNSS